MSTRVPRGSKWVALKLNAPKIAAYADKDGLCRADLTRLRVSSACGISLSHSAMGKSGSHVYRPATKWFLKVLMALSAALR